MPSGAILCDLHTSPTLNVTRLQLRPRRRRKLLQVDWWTWGTAEMGFTSTTKRPGTEYSSSHSGSRYGQPLAANTLPSWTIVDMNVLNCGSLMAGKPYRHTIGLLPFIGRSRATPGTSTPVSGCARWRNSNRYAM